MTIFRYSIVFPALALLAGCHRQSSEAALPAEHDYSSEVSYSQESGSDDVMNVINMGEPDQARLDAVHADTQMRANALANQTKLLEQAQSQQQVNDLQRRVDQLEFQQSIDTASQYAGHPKP